MVDLGIPSAPAPTLAPRRKSRQLKVGSVLVGGDAPVSVQSMCHPLPGHKVGYRYVRYRPETGRVAT